MTKDLTLFKRSAPTFVDRNPIRVSIADDTTNKGGITPIADEDCRKCSPKDLTLFY